MLKLEIGGGLRVCRGVGVKPWPHTQSSQLYQRHHWHTLNAPLTLIHIQAPSVVTNPSLLFIHGLLSLCSHLEATDEPVSPHTCHSSATHSYLNSGPAAPLIIRLLQLQVAAATSEPSLISMMYRPLLDDCPHFHFISPLIHSMRLTVNRFLTTPLALPFLPCYLTKMPLSFHSLYSHLSNFKSHFLNLGTK